MAESDVGEMLKDISRFIAKNDMQKCESMCRKVLKVDPENVLALHNLSVSLLKKSRYSACYQLLKGCQDESMKTFFIYTTFALGKDRIASQLLANKSSKTMLDKIIQAKLYSKEGKLEDAIELLQCILQHEKMSSSKATLESFRLSLIASKGPSFQTQEVYQIERHISSDPQNTSGCEDMFNSGCYWIWKGNFSLALQFFNKALDYINFHKQDKSWNEKEKRVIFHKTQIQIEYCKQILEVVKPMIFCAESDKNQWKMMLSRTPQDLSFTENCLIMENNYISDLLFNYLTTSDLRTRSALTITMTSRFRLFNHHFSNINISSPFLLRSLYLNKFVIYLVMRKNSEAKIILSKVSLIFPDMIPLLQSIQLFSKNRIMHSFEKLTEFRNQTTNVLFSSKLVSLLHSELLRTLDKKLELIQFLSSDNHFNILIEKSIPAAVYFVSLCCQFNEYVPKVVKIVDKAAAYHVKSGKMANLKSFLIFVYGMLARKGFQSESQQILEKLTKLFPQSASNQAHLQTIMSNLATSSGRGLSLSDVFTGDEDIPNLEKIEEEMTRDAANVGQSAKSTSIGSGEKISNDPKMSGIQKKRRHRKKKAKPPKNFDPTVDPDPNRWLPKYMRPGFKSKRKDYQKHKNMLKKQTQGSVSDETTTYDSKSEYFASHIPEKIAKLGKKRVRR